MIKDSLNAYMGSHGRSPPDIRNIETPDLEGTRARNHPFQSKDVQTPSSGGGLYTKSE